MFIISGSTKILVDQLMYNMHEKNLNNNNDDINNN